MSHIHTRKLIENRTNYAGRSWIYEFHSIPRYCDEETVAQTSGCLFQKIAPITKDWNDNWNSEWILRIYFAAKMILASSIMAQSLEFAKAKNLRAVISYLDYYTVFNMLRSILLTNPSVSWNNGEILKTSHKKTINVSIDILSQFNKEVANKINTHSTYLKAFRELISYRAPSSGGSFQKTDIDVIEICRLLAEIAQLQSELIEASILKNVKGNFSLKTEAIDHICNNEIDGFTFRDNEDRYRMEYLQRKYPLPTNILHIMSEGHVEDFFGSWCALNKEGGQFDPDNNWRILFDVP